MSRVIVVCGLSGSGKTTLAKELSRRLNIACLHKDSVKEKLYESLGCSTLEQSRQTGLYAIQLILALAEEQIANGVDVILESPFNHEDNAKLFHAWKKKYDIDFYAVICEVDQETRMQRRSDRPRHSAHHEAFRLREGVSFSPEEWDYASMPEKKIFVRTEESVNASINAILQELG